MHDATLSTLIGCAILILLSWLSGQLGGLFQSTSSLAQQISFVAAIIGFTFVRVLPNGGLWPVVIRIHRLIKYGAMFYGIFYIVSFAIWMLNPFSFSSNLVAETLYVPVILFPALFGVSGLFAIFCFAFLWKPHKRNDIFILALILIASLSLGALISIVNIYFGDLGYGARRFLPLCFAVATLMAAILLFEQIKRMYSKHQFLSVFTLSLIVLSGVISTNINLAYWSGFTPTEVSGNTDEAISFLSSPLERDPRTPILTVGDLSRYSIESIPSTYLIDRYRLPIWNSPSPEIPLMLLQSDSYLPPHVYIHQRDLSVLEDKYSSGYVSSHYSEFFTESFSNPEVTIFESPSGSPPSPISDTVLVIDDYTLRSNLYALDMLSFGNYEFTTCISSDLVTFAEGSIVIIPGDNEGNMELIEKITEISESETLILIVNTDGFGPIANHFFESVSLEIIQATTIVKQTESINLPSNVFANRLTTNANSSVVATYSDGTIETPLAVRLSEDTITQVYLNLLPIVNASQQTQGWASNDFAAILSKLIDVSGIPLESNHNFESWCYSGNTAMFNSANMRGDILVETQSVSAIDNSGLVNVSIEMNGYAVEVLGIQAITISNGNCRRIQASEIHIADGFGFYSKISSPKIRLYFEGINNELTLLTNQNDTFVMPIQNQWVSIVGDIGIISRNPTDLHVVGVSDFESMYSLFELYPELRSSGHNLTIGGTMECTIPASATITFLSDVVWIGAASRTPRVYGWTEFPSIILTLIVSSIVAVPLILIQVIRRYRPEFLKYLKMVGSSFNPREKGIHEESLII
jgi:hypothetical protein